MVPTASFRADPDLIAPFKVLTALGLSAAGLSAASFTVALMAVTWVDAIAPLTSALVAVGTIYLTVHQRRNESKIAEHDRNQRSQQDFINDLRADNAEQAAELRDLRRTVARMFGVMIRWRNGVSRLVSQLEKEGHEPIWRPGPLEELDSFHVPENDP